MKTALIVVCLLALCQAEDDMTVVKRGSRRYCGKDLRVSLMLLCDSIYKRGYTQGMSSSHDNLMESSDIEESLSVFPFRSRPEAYAVLPGFFRRHSRGAADECCHKPCTINELKTYCGTIN